MHIPSDLLVRLAPKAAAWCAVNFQYNNIFDNSAARRDLGFRYTIPFVEGIRHVVAGIAAFENADDFPFYERLIEVWQRAGAEMVQALT